MINSSTNFDLHRGYTLLELLIVVALTVIVAGFIFVGFIKYGDEQRTSSVLIEIKSLLKETKQKTTAAETDSQFGVYFATSSMVVFEGALYSDNDPENIVYNFPDFNISPELSGGVFEVVFARLTGEPSATGTITIDYVRSSSTRSLVINNSGLIE